MLPRSGNMDKLLIGNKLDIHSYKHNGHPHRVWDEAIFLDDTEDYTIFANNKTRVIESDGRTRKTKETAILYFSKKHWFNIIGQVKPTGIYYYCNIASPFVIENETIKYIDYDLDLRVFPDGAFKILDRGEYNYHKRIMHYSDELDIILREELDVLIEMVKKKEFPFNYETINHYYGEYKMIKKIT